MKKFITRLNMALKWAKLSAATNECFPKTEFYFLQNHLALFLIRSVKGISNASKWISQ